MRKNYKVPNHIRNFIKKELYSYISNEKLIKEQFEEMEYKV